METNHKNRQLNSFCLAHRTKQRPYIHGHDVQNMNIGYFLGPAGSGKSHATATLYDWMNRVELDVITVNLDPAVVRLPYAPAIDIRNYVSYDDIVDRFELGPNGAIIAAMDQVAVKMDEVIEELKEYGAEYVLIDLPGQMEAFAFRGSGPVIISELSRGNVMAGAFLIDPILCSTASSLISILLFGLSISYRLKTGMSFAISKGDLIQNQRLQRMQEWVENPEFLMDDLRVEHNVLNAELSQRIAQLVIEHEHLNEFPVISSETHQNIDLIFAEFQRIWNSEDLFA